MPLAIAIYDDINESDIAGYESDLRRGGHEYEAALLYALRVSRNVPKFKKINTLFKRYELALHGPSGNYVIGLLAAKETANYQRTYDFLTFLYVNRFIEISQSLLDKAALTALQRKTQKAKINVWQKTYDDINNNCSRAQDLFLYSMRPIRSHKARCKKEILKIKRS